MSRPGIIIMLLRATINKEATRVVGLFTYKKFPG